MKIYLIRHGRTSWNDGGKWQGKTDIPLDSAGEAQSRALARRLARLREPIKTIYSSDLIRARRTAEIITETCGAEIVYLPELREIDLGSWEGRTIDEISGLDGFDEWEANGRVAPHGGESFEQTRDRVTGAMYRIAAEQESDFAVVSHGTAIRLFIGHILEIPIAKKMSTVTYNAAFSVVRYDRETGRFSVITVNDYCHLEDMGY